MASTEQIRKWFHEGVVLNHASRGQAGYKPVCNHNHPRVSFPSEGGASFAEPVHPLTVEAFEAYVSVMKQHGETMSGAGGVNACRNIGTSNNPSLHAYLCAVDLPPNSRKSTGFLADMGRIRTNSGAVVFRNLSGDRMHDQINCSPADLATGIDWNTVVGTGTGEEAVLPLRPTSPPEDIRSLQGRLNTTYGAGLVEDTNWGPLTAAVVRDNLLDFTGSDEAGDIPVQEGVKVNARMWNGLLADLIRKVAPAGSKGDKGDKGNTGSQGLPGVDGDDGIDGLAVKELIKATNLVP